MEAFLKFFDTIADQHGFKLEIYYSSIMDWCINIGFKTTHPDHGTTIVAVQTCDIELAFAKAQVELKEWLCTNKGGY